ncbi:hypothetical protein [Lelliottia wanjuensis]|uniref:Uncharacterized protein n=1 Tax=Lelliottia wanjuensis TaxID=3050585 RepID=A0AAP4D2U2_9ENTR|nr:MULTISPECIES: hypothetical protein [unclassified Lelliottia]MDK9364156.1 hypothetical protein [Lelliottia sp. V106_12]MDK9585399.1 hypothetical protein [Lelliottia sp. V86_10]MDK9617167.1 hypothetical protein [Lelliottia sp. V106_9]
MIKNKGYSLGFTSNDIERIAKNSTAEVAAKQIVTISGRSNGTVAVMGSRAQAPSPKGIYRELSGRKAPARSSKQTEALAGSILSKNSSGYSSKQAVDMFNQAFKKVKA